MFQKSHRQYYVPVSMDLSLLTAAGAALSESGGQFQIDRMRVI
jgi:hypothetical protein